MQRTMKQNLLESWLQDVSETAEELLAGLHGGRVHFTNDDGACEKLIAVLLDADLQMDAYGKHCADTYSEPDYKPESDPGPSQEQRS